MFLFETLYLPLLVDLTPAVIELNSVEQKLLIQIKGLTVIKLFIWLIEVLTSGGFIGSVLRWCLKDGLFDCSGFSFTAHCWVTDCDLFSRQFLKLQVLES